MLIQIIKNFKHSLTKKIPADYRKNKLSCIFWQSVRFIILYSSRFQTFSYLNNFGDDRDGAEPRQHPRDSVDVYLGADYRRDDQVRRDRDARVQ